MLRYERFSVFEFGAVSAQKKNLYLFNFVGSPKRQNRGALSVFVRNASSFCNTFFAKKLAGLNGLAYIVCVGSG